MCKDGSVYCARVILALMFPDMAACFVGRKEEDVIRVILPDVTREEISNIIETVMLIRNRLVKVKGDRTQGG